METRKNLIVMIADSRGKELQEEIRKRAKPKYDIRVITLPGKGLVAAVCEAESKLFWWQPSQVYILAGICDITKKDKWTHKVSLREKTGKNMQTK